MDQYYNYNNDNNNYTERYINNNYNYVYTCNYNGNSLLTVSNKLILNYLLLTKDELVIILTYIIMHLVKVFFEPDHQIQSHGRR